MSGTQEPDQQPAGSDEPQTILTPGYPTAAEWFGETDEIRERQIDHDHGGNDLNAPGRASIFTTDVALAQRENVLDIRDNTLNQREFAQINRHYNLNAREIGLGFRHEMLDDRQRHLDASATSLDERAEELDQREEDLHEEASALRVGERDLTRREFELAAMQRNLGRQLRDANAILEERLNAPAGRPPSPDWAHMAAPFVAAARQARNVDAEVGTVIARADLGPDDVNCPICGDEYGQPSSDNEELPVRLTECCRNIVGRACLEHWLRDHPHPSCPFCRANFREMAQNRGGIDDETRQRPDAVILGLDSAGSGSRPSVPHSPHSWITGPRVRIDFVPHGENDSEAESSDSGDLDFQSDLELESSDFGDPDLESDSEADSSDSEDSDMEEEAEDTTDRATIRTHEDTHRGASASALEDGPADAPASADAPQQTSLLPTPQDSAREIIMDNTIEVDGSSASLRPFILHGLEHYSPEEQDRIFPRVREWTSMFSQALNQDPEFREAMRLNPPAPQAGGEVGPRWNNLRSIMARIRAELPPLQAVDGEDETL